jgi:uncharacterized protein (TIGR00730 family)
MFAASGGFPDPERSIGSIASSVADQTWSSHPGHVVLGRRPAPLLAVGVVHTVSARGTRREHVMKPQLAYEDSEFLRSDEARPLRILAEYLGPLRRFHRENVADTIVFFGSARLDPGGPLGRYYAEARELARGVTAWSKSLPSHARRFIVCSGGGGGIMEAANRGASDAGGLTIGLNIGLPHEQRPNRWVTRELSIQFNYFFMRKLWFAYLARALVVFPGGFGTLDELMEILTLAQTRKLDRRIPVLLYGTRYWNEIVNFEALVRHGMIAREDLDLFAIVDDPATALRLLQARLAPVPEEAAPALAHSRTPDEP